MLRDRGMAVPKTIATTGTCTYRDDSVQARKVVKRLHEKTYPYILSLLPEIILQTVL